MSKESAGRQGRRRGGRNREAAEPAIAQLPWQRVRNHHPPMAILAEDQLEAIEETGFRLLEELGIECVSAEACRRFAEGGAEVDSDTMTVRIDRGLLRDLIAKAPPAFALTPRNPERRVHIGGADVATTLVSGPPNVHDRVEGRRASNLDDYCNFIRLTQSFNAVHMIGNQVAAPIELDAETRHLDCYLANLTLSDRSYHCTAIGRDRALDGIAMMAIARGLDGAADLIGDPAVSTVISVNSPRRFDEAMAEGLMAMAEHGQGVCITPFTLMGAMSPVTLPAALAQQNAEALFGMALCQLVRPGTPVIYGAFTSNVDMRSGAPAFGTPEHAKALIASGQLARRYGLPYRATACSAANLADAQAVWEQMMGFWGCVLGGANLWYHAAGWLEGGLLASYEKFVLDAEMIQEMFAFMQPLEVDDATLGFEALARVPTGGHFFGDAHTLERYQSAFYAPMLSDWRNHEQWAADGAQSATERATALWQKALAEYAEPAMDPAIREALDAYVARRKTEIAAGGV